MEGERESMQGIAVAGAHLSHLQAHDFVELLAGRDLAVVVAEDARLVRGELEGGASATATLAKNKNTHSSLRNPLRAERRLLAREGDTSRVDAVVLRRVGRERAPAASNVQKTM